MPSFNQARYLEEAIASVVGQNYPGLELIVLDGGSSDGTKEILESHAGAFSYWRSCPDKGQTAALIEGFSLATGDLIGWLNSDDVLLPGALLQIAKSSAADPSAEFFGGNHLWLDELGRIIKCKRHPHNPRWWARHGLMAVNQPGSFFSKKAYERVGGLNPELEYVMDTDLYVRMLNSGTRFHYVDAWLSGFRVHPSAKTSAHRDRKELEHARTFAGYWLAPMLPGVLQRRLWRLLYRCWQVLIGNYAKMSVETVLAYGQHWRHWASHHSPTS